MRTVCIVQARMNSKRLPGKVLLPLNGHTVIEEVLDRCQKIDGVDDVICAIPDTAECDRLAAVAGDLAGVFRGPLDDVLGRYRQAAEWARADRIMRITADCPLLSPGICGFVLECWSSDIDYISNIFPTRTYPQGYDCEVFTFDALLDADINVTEAYDREHVTPWMQRNLSYGVVMAPYQMDGRLTLDTIDDYKMISTWFKGKSNG